MDLPVNELIALVKKWECQKSELLAEGLLSEADVLSVAIIEIDALLKKNNVVMLKAV